MSDNFLPPFTGVIYSAPGGGKTVLAGTILEIPEWLPMLLIDIDGKTDSIHSKLNKVTFDTLDTPVMDKINVLSIRTIPNFDKLLDYFNNRKQANPYRTVVIDSFTKLDRTSMNEICLTSPYKKMEIDVPEQRDYLKNMGYMIQAIEWLTSFNMNVILNCHQYLEEKTGDIHPAISGQLRVIIPGSLKFTGRLFVQNQKRYIRFQPSGSYAGGACIEGNYFSDKIENPTFKIINDLRKKAYSGV